MDKNLHEIGDKYGTDKIYKSATHKVSTLNIYDFVFKENFDLNSNLNILEIGVRKGPSIEMLLDFFPNSEIYGLDIADCPPKLESKDRFTFLKGNQGKLEDLKKLTSLCKKFDLIIDDGGHIINEFTFSYNYLIDYLNVGGVYIIEDLYNCYEFWNKHRVTRNNKNGEEFNSFISDLNYKIHKSRQFYDKSPIFSIHSYPGLLMIKKSLQNG